MSWIYVPSEEGSLYFRSGVEGCLGLSEETLNVLLLIGAFPEANGLREEKSGLREWWSEDVVFAFGYRLGLTKKEMLGHEALFIDDGNDTEMICDDES